MIEMLLINLATIVGVMLLLWLVAVAIRDVSFIDAVWAYGMVGLAWLSAWQVWPGSAGEDGPALHAWLLLALVTLWGLRLGTHLLLRWRRLGRDPRYDRMLGGMADRPLGPLARDALVKVFLLQGPLLWFVSLPAQAGIIAPTGNDALGWLGWAGVLVALVGIAFETIGDAQLNRFRADPANKGRVMDRGLWRYTRHPNYFGDACAWWGIWLIAAEAGVGLFTLASPIFLTWTLVKWSGAALLERGLSKSRPGYADYIARTSAFVPWPPTRS